MMELRLQQQLDGLAQLRRRTRLGRNLAVCWTLAAIVGLILFAIQNVLGENFYRYLWLSPLPLGVIMATIVFFRQPSQPDATEEVIRDLEPHHPEIRHLLATAAEQKPGAASGEYSYLQLRVIEEVLAHPRQAVWREQLQQRLLVVQIFQAVTLLGLAASLFTLKHAAAPGTTFAGLPILKGISVTPGDTQVERGTGLVVSIKFGDAPPAEATLVMMTETGHESRLPMSRRLADPVFGANIPEISEPGIYRIEYGATKTRDFKVTVFEFPALIRADADLRYPAYTGLTNRTFRDALRVSAVEGSHVTYTMQLNKPVARVRLVNKNQSLTLATSNAVALLPDYVLTNTARFSLELLDAAGRSNKFATDFVLQALTNQRPIVRLVFPRGDPRVSPLEELQLSAEASDDFGLVKYGIGYGVAGQEPQFVELGQAAPGNVKKQFGLLVSLEKLGVVVEQAVAYFAWADDYGPDGQVRRTFSDMFFAEVRPFEEVYRPDQSGGSEGGNQPGQGGGGNERVRLAELQKQIVVATWNLQREKTGAGRAPHP